MKKENKKEYGSFRKKMIVNGITLSRILAAFALIPIYHLVGGAAAFGFLIAMFCTDFIDGTLARGWKVSSFFGSIADAVSDKVLAIIAAILLFPTFPLAIGTVLGMEALIFGKNLYEAKKGNHIHSSLAGKIKTWPLAATLVAGFAIADIGGMVSSLQALPTLCESISFEPLRNFLSAIANAVTTGVMPVLETVKENPEEVMGVFAAATVATQGIALESYFRSGHRQSKQRKVAEQNEILSSLSIEDQDLLSLPKSVQKAYHAEEIKRIEEKIAAIKAERSKLSTYRMKSKDEIIKGLFDTPYFEEHKDESIRKLLLEPNDVSHE